MSEMRRGSERRSKPTPLFNPYLLTGKSEDHRRVADLKQNVYVDRFNSIEWSVVFLLLFLCVADAFLTIIHLCNGAQEINPILDGAYCYGGITGFILTKSALTFPSVFLFLMHVKNSLAQKGLKLLLVLYSVIVVYQLTPWLIPAFWISLR